MVTFGSSVVEISLGSSLTPKLLTKSSSQWHATYGTATPEEGLWARKGWAGTP